MSQIDPNIDPFDIKNLRLSQDYTTEVGARKKLITVPVRKPTKAEFVRVHADPAYRLDTLLLELKDQRGEAYLIGHEIRDQIASESTVGARRLVTAVNRQGITFLWPLRLPGPDGRLDPWGQSALDIAVIAQDSWVRVTSNTSLGAYEASVATGDIGKPAWPTESLLDLLRIAFNGRVIREWDHPVLKVLRGEL